MAERQEFSFTPGELGILSTFETVEASIEAGENFLNSDPEDIRLASKKKEQKAKSKDEEEDGQEEESTEDQKKSNPKSKEKKPIKEEVIKPKEIDESSFFGSFDNEDDTDDEEIEEQEEEKKPSKKPVKDPLKIEESETKQEGIEEDKTSDSEDEQNTYSIIAQELLNNGIFTLDEGEENIEINTPQDFLERWNYESGKSASYRIEKFLSQHGDDYRDMFDNVFVKGIPPIDYLNRYTRIENIKSLELTDEDNQEKIVRELYRSEGRSAEYIEKRVNQLKSYGDLNDEATEAQRILVDKENKSLQEEVTKKQEEIARKQQIRKEYLSNIGAILTAKVKTKEFDGIPVTRDFAEQTMKYISQEKYQTPDKQTLTEFDKDILELNRPENHPMKVKVAMLLQLLRDDPSLTKLAKKAVSKEANQLFQGLKKNAMKSSQAGKTNKEQEEGNESWFPKQNS